MKHLDQMQQGGYPFDDISIDYLQKMHNDRDSFLFSVFGDKKIVSGCILTPETSMVSDGLITYNGKLYHFVGGNQQTQISLKKVETSRNYEDGNQKKAFINEFFEFGTNGTSVMSFSSLKRWYQNQPIIGETKEIAGNIDNNSLPPGWFIADGTNGTQDLRSKFIVGWDNRDSDYDNMGSTGGVKKQTQVPKHRHGYKDIYYSEISGTVTVPSNYGSNDSDNDNKGLEIARTTEYTGVDAVENRPPYYVAVRIQFVGI